MDNRETFTFSTQDRKQLSQHLSRHSGFTNDQISQFLDRAEEYVRKYIAMSTSGRNRSKNEILKAIDKVAKHAKNLSEAVDDLYSFSPDEIKRETDEDIKSHMKTSIPYFSAFTSVIDRRPHDERIKFGGGIKIIPNEITPLLPDISIFLDDFQERLLILQELPEETRKYTIPDRNDKTTNNIKEYFVVWLGMAYQSIFETKPSCHVSTIFMNFLDELQDLMLLDKFFPSPATRFRIGKDVVASALGRPNLQHLPCSLIFFRKRTGVSSQPPHL